MFYQVRLFYQSSLKKQLGETIFPMQPNNFWTDCIIGSVLEFKLCRILLLLHKIHIVTRKDYTATLQKVENTRRVFDVAKWLLHGFRGGWLVSYFGLEIPS